MNKSFAGFCSAAVLVIGACGSDENNLPIKESEAHVPMPKGAHFVVDSQRLWHVGVHNGTKPRYAAIISCESSPELNAWIESKK